MTILVFPNYIGAITGVDALELGVRYAWIHVHGAGILRVPRSSFSAFSFTRDKPSAELVSAVATHARKLVDAALAVPK